MGRVNTIKDLERIIGIISYARRCVKDVEKVLGPLREVLRIWKAQSVLETWIDQLNEKVDTALAATIDNTHWLVLPGVKSEDFKFVIESDWSSGHVGYMLFAWKRTEE